MRVEVRCCCDAGSLLGWIEMPDMTEQRLAKLKSIKFPIYQNARPRSYPCVQLEVGIMRRPRFVEPTTEGADNIVADYEEYPALKSGHLPIETLKRILGFKENDLLSHHYVSGEDATDGL